MGVMIHTEDGIGNVFYMSELKQLRDKLIGIGDGGAQKSLCDGSHVGEDDGRDLLTGETLRLAFYSTKIIGFSYILALTLKGIKRQSTSRYFRPINSFAPLNKEKLT